MLFATALALSLNTEACPADWKKTSYLAARDSVVSIDTVGVSIEHIVPVAFDRTVAEETKRAHACFDKLVTVNAEAGFGLYRTNGILWSLAGSRETTRGRAVVNFHAETTFALCAKPAPFTVFRSEFNVRVYFLSPAGAITGIRDANPLIPPRRSAKVFPSWSKLPANLTGAPGTVSEGTLTIKVTWTVGSGFILIGASVTSPFATEAPC